jgi:hypothetical protein
LAAGGSVVIGGVVWAPVRVLSSALVRVGTLAVFSACSGARLARLRRVGLRRLALDFGLERLQLGMVGRHAQPLFYGLQCGLGIVGQVVLGSTMEVGRSGVTGTVRLGGCGAASEQTQREKPQHPPECTTEGPAGAAM